MHVFHHSYAGVHPTLVAVNTSVSLSTVVEHLLVVVTLFCCAQSWPYRSAVCHRRIEARLAVGIAHEDAVVGQMVVRVQVFVVRCGELVALAVLCHHALAVERCAVCHVVGVALFLCDAVDVPSSECVGKLVFHNVCHTAYTIAIERIATVILPACEYYLRILGDGKLTVEHRAVRLVRVDVSPSVREVLT